MAYSTMKDLFKAICDAIRSKDGTTGSINHQDIPARIQAISGSGSDSGTEVVIQSLNITENGTYTAPAGVGGYSPVTVNVPSSGIDTSDAISFSKTIDGINTTSVSSNAGYYSDISVTFDDSAIVEMLDAL